MNSGQKWLYESLSLHSGHRRHSPKISRIFAILLHIQEDIGLE